MTFLVRDTKGKITDLSNFDSVEETSGDGKDLNFPMFRVKEEPVRVKIGTDEQQASHTLFTYCLYVKRMELKFTNKNQTMVVKMLRPEGFGGYGGIIIGSPPFQKGTFEITLSEPFLNDESNYEKNLSGTFSRIISAKKWKKISAVPEIQNKKWRKVGDITSRNVEIDKSISLAP